MDARIYYKLCLKYYLLFLALCLNESIICDVHFCVCLCVFAITEFLDLWLKTVLIKFKKKFGLEIFNRPGVAGAVL